MKTKNLAWFNLPESEVLVNTGSSTTHGLSAEEVAGRKQMYGVNSITQKKTTGPLILFLQQFNQPLVYILVAATIVTAALREWVDSSVIIDPCTDRSLQECLTAGLLCNDSTLVFKENRWKIEGDPTEGALLTAGQKAGFPRENLFKKYHQIDSIPFESQHQYMATLDQVINTQDRIIYMKGSTERVLSRCTDVLLNSGSTEPFDSAKYHQVANEIARKGLRVLAFARRTYKIDKVTISHEDVSGGMTFLGFQAMIDPPRPEAIKAVKACKMAGIDVKMITGDHELM